MRLYLTRVPNGVPKGQEFTRGLAAVLHVAGYVHATVGFDQLSNAAGISKESLMRMLSTKGNPSRKNVYPRFRA